MKNIITENNLSREEGKKQMPKVSVIIPCYNRAHLLPECIKSVLAQTFTDFEIIVIDDGSTDNTREVALTFPVKYQWQENQGPPGARNRGIELSQGEYITFLDSDDALLERTLEKDVEVLERYPAAAFSHGQVYNMDEKGNVFGLEKPRTKEAGLRDGIEEIRDLLAYGNHVISSTIMIRRSCLESVGRCDPAYRLGSVDLNLWINLARRYPVVYIAEPLAKFRMHAQSFCAGRDLGEWEQTNGLILENIFNDEELGQKLSYLRNNAFFRLYSALADRACRRGQRKVARHYISKAWEVYSWDLPKSLTVNLALLLAKMGLPEPVISVSRTIKRRLTRSR